ncbi:MAG: hypothetical protein OXE87_01595 [Chloroflexi bacterium]|nr:hypothetical protein [Chloroflexota bacterium]
MTTPNFADKTVWTRDNLDNLQLLCAHGNRVKEERPQGCLVARLREIGMAGRWEICRVNT